MKKLLCILLAPVLLSFFLAGCIDKDASASEKKEEELKAEIRAELEAEQRLRDELKAEIKAEMDAAKKFDKNTEVKNSSKPANSASNSKMDTQDKEEPAVVLSILMTKGDIVKKLGSSHTVETSAGGYFEYNSVIKYEGVSFSFYHDSKEVPENKCPDVIDITSNKYTMNYGFKIGDPALKAFEYCEKHLKKAVNQHSNNEIFGWYLYKEKDNSAKVLETGHFLAWDYSTGKKYSSKSEITEDVKIKSISVFGTID